MANNLPINELFYLLNRGEFMTLDEAIAHARDVANEQKRRSGICIQNDSECDKFSDCLKCAEEHKQIAEWLEELKFLRQWKSDIMDSFCKYDVNSFEELVANTRNKAINDFVKFANTMPTVEEEDGEVRPMWLEEMAEQLKAGGNIELSEYSKSQGNRTRK